MRYQLMINKIKNNQKNQNMLESGTSNFIPNSTLGNSTLATEQFYRQLPSSGYNESRQNGSSSAPPVTESATTAPSFVGSGGVSGYAPSMTSTVFRLPQTTNNFRIWHTYTNRMNCIIRLLQQCEDQGRVRLVVRLMETAVSVILNNEHFNTDPQLELELIFNTFKDTYYSGRIPKPFSSMSSVTSENQFDPNKNNNQVMRNNFPAAGSSMMMDMSSNMSGRIQKPHSSVSSVTSEQHQLDPYRNNNQLTRSNITSASSMMMDITSTMNPRVVLDNNFGPQRNQVNRTENNYTNTFNHTNLAMSSGHRPELTQQQVGITNASKNLEESSLSLFSDSLLAQRRDEIASRQHKLQNMTDMTASESVSRSKGRPKTTKAKAAVLNKINNSRVRKSTPLRTISENKRPTNEQHTIAAQTSIQNLNMNQTLSKGVKAVTRTGRQIKSPVQFWKGNESHINDTPAARRAKKLYASKENVDLNESMTLRNSKVIDKSILQLKKNYTKGSASNTPLNAISENLNITIDNKINKPLKEKPKKPESKKEKKENGSAQRKPTKKQKSKNESAASDLVKENTTKSKLAEKKVPKKPVQRKRKSKELNNDITKKKKFEDVSTEDFGGNITSDDELFGEVFSRKITKPILQNVVSPTTGLLSVKKLGEVPLSKETPPCKSLGQLMNTTAVSAASSTLKGVPAVKRNKVVKRVEKIVEKGKKDSKKPQANKNTKKKQEELFPSYTAVTPLTVATFSMALGREEESDENSSFTDEDDEDLI